MGYFVEVISKKAKGREKKNVSVIEDLVYT